MRMNFYFSFKKLVYSTASHTIPCIKTQLSGSDAWIKPRNTHGFSIVLQICITIQNSGFDAMMQ